jgi:hypothetical protein
MYSESEKRRNRIQSRVREGKVALLELEATLAGNSDKHVNDLLRQASNWLNDVEVSFLGMLAKDQQPPRTIQQEAFILDHAEFFLERVAMLQVKSLQDLVAKFGPNLQSVG